MRRRQREQSGSLPTLTLLLHKDSRQSQVAQLSLQDCIILRK